jgi:hypothetical protein
LCDRIAAHVFIINFCMIVIWLRLHFLPEVYCVLVVIDFLSYLTLGLRLRLILDRIQLRKLLKSSLIG